MYPIEQVTNDTLQRQVLVLPDGSFIDLTICFVPMQAGWFIRTLIYGTFIVHNIRITTGPDMLYQFKNQIPFGLACFNKDNREPTFQQDFSSGACKLYVLTSDEVTELTGAIQNG